MVDDWNVSMERWWGWYWQRRAETLRGRTIPVSFCPAQFAHNQVFDSDAENLFQCHTVHNKSHIYRSLIRTGKIEVLLQKPIPVPHCAPQIPHTQVFDTDRENRSTSSKTYSSVTLCTTNPTYTGLWFGRGKPKYLFKNLCQCHIVHHKSHIYRSLIRTGKTEVLVHKPIPVSHCAPQIPHTQVFDSDAENRSTWREPCPNVTLFTANPKVTDVE